MKISSDNSQEYFKNPTSNETLHTRRNLESVPSVPSVPGSERQPAHRITSASLQSFPPQGPENHLQAHQYKPKTWNIHIDRVNHTLMRQIQLFMAPTKKQNPTTTIRHLPPNAYNFGNQLSRNIPTKHNRATLYSTSTFMYNFENVTSVRKCWTFSSTHIIIIPWRLTPCAHAEANIPGEYPRIFLTGITA